MAKRWIALLCALALTLGLAACADKAPAPEDPSSEAVSSAPQSEVESAPESTPESAPAPEPQNAPAGVSVLTGLPLPEDALEGQRPIALMVHNTQRAWPQRGMGNAHVVVEMPIGDGDTAIMAFFPNHQSVESAGPVAPIQDQFAQMALPVQAIPVHIGATQYATNLFTVLGYKTLNGIQLGTTSFVYDYGRTLPRPGGKLHEYSWYTGGDYLYAGMEFLDVSLVGEMPTILCFGENTPADADAAREINVVYSDKSATSFGYNPDAGLYYDYFNGQRRAPDHGEGGDTIYNNVVILSCRITTKEDSEEYLEFDFSGGDGWLFTGGGVQNIKWVKGGPTAPLTLYDADNREVSVNTGHSYIGFVPSNAEDPVTWKNAAQVAEEAAAAEEGEGE